MDLATLHAGVKRGLALRTNDPLRWWHHSSEQSRRATALLQTHDEVYCRAANKAGKTQWQYAVGLALLQKRPHLDGVVLPQWRGKIEAVSLEVDHPTQKLSSQKAILALVGDWPHKASYQAGGVLSSLKVMPVGGNPDDMRNWSEITFQSQKNLAAGTGVRADLVLANEPPRQDIWEEIRKAAEAGRIIRRIIGATPLKRSQWYWLADQYKPEAPRDGMREHRGWVEVRWSLEHNSALSREEMDTLLWEYAKNPATYDARVYGDYCNTSGRCPFDETTLLSMLKDPKWAREPRKIEGFPVPFETGDGVKHEEEVLVEVYDYPSEGMSYYEPLDGSSGIDDSLHDPSGFLVAAMGSGDLQVRYVGPLASYRLGILGVGVARQYRNAGMDPEKNQWSMAIMQAINDSRYGHVAQETQQMGYGEVSKSPGFTTDHKTRNASISAIQAWIEAYRMGIPYARPCRKIIECLLDTVLDEKGKPVAGPGAHDEDMILWGMVLRKAVRRSNMPIPQIQQPIQTPNAALVALIQGRGPKPVQGAMPRLRSRPRV